MLFINSVTIITLALGVVAKSTIVPRDEASITKVLKDVTDLTLKLDQIVKVFGGDPEPLKAASASLLAGINAGITVVQASNVLDLPTSGAIGTPTLDLNTTVAATVADLINKKQALVQAGQGPTIYKSLQDQKVAADTLAKTILSKLDVGTQELGNTLSAGITISLQFGIDAFKDVGTAVPAPETAIVVGLPTTAAPAPSTPAAPVNGTSSTKAHTKSTGAYDTPTAPSKTSSTGYDLPTPSKSTKSAPGYGYDTPTASAKPTKSAPGYGYDTPSAPAPKPTKSAPGYGYDSPPAYDSPSGKPPGPSKSKTWAPVPVSTTKTAPPAVFTAGAAINGLSGGLAVLAAAVMVL